VNSEEQERTKRYYAFLGVGGLIVLVVVILFFSKVGKGTLTVNEKGFTVTIDRPLIEQVQTKPQELTTESKKVRYSTGSIADSVVRQFERQVGEPLQPDRFVGKNLVDKRAGFVLASKMPRQWSISHDVAGYADMQRNMVELNSAGGATVKVSRMPSSVVRGCMSAKCVVDYVLNILTTTGETVQDPHVSVDETSKTAMIQYRNLESQEESIIKLVLSDEYWYQVSTRYNVTTSTADAQTDAAAMVASFAVIN